MIPLDAPWSSVKRAPVLSADTRLLSYGVMDRWRMSQPTQALLCVCRTVVPFTRVCRVGIWCGFVRFALLLAVVLCWVDRCFDSWLLLGLFCLLRVTQPLPLHCTCMDSELRRSMPYPLYSSSRHEQTWPPSGALAFGNWSSPSGSTSRPWCTSRRAV